MAAKLDYTSRARIFTASFPIFSYVLIQISFWIIANIFLGLMIHLQSSSIGQTVTLPAPSRLGPNLIIAVIVGALYGTILGLTDYYLDRGFFKRKSLGKIILLKAIISLVVLVLLFALIRFVLYDLLIAQSFYNGSLTVNPESWKYLFFEFLVFYFFMSLIIIFINEVNKKYGPGVLLPILLGKYRSPKEEERIFMFMDLKSSTAIAEALGHLQYSSFIRDSFMDISQVLFPFNAEVYQYVGDEIVVSWKVNEGLKDLFCVKFFFECENQFEKRKEYYFKKYGLVPQFKAGLHVGKVTAVEIGEIKRDIAYHGDTLNTTARIQSMCNEYKKKFLVSAYFFEISNLNEYFETEKLGMILLKGKKVPIGLLSVEGSVNKNSLI